MLVGSPNTKPLNTPGIYKIESKLYYPKMFIQSILFQNRHTHSEQTKKISPQERFILSIKV